MQKNSNVQCIMQKNGRSFKWLISVEDVQGSFKWRKRDKLNRWELIIEEIVGIALSDRYFERTGINLSKIYISENYYQEYLDWMIIKYNCNR